MNTKLAELTKYYLETVEIEAQAVADLVEQIPADLAQIVTSIIETKGKLIITGMGKSGLIGRKIAATLSSTGTSSFFVHPAEAYHGDLGMIRHDDIVLAISNSGETEEILRLISYLKFNRNTLIAMTGNPKSTLATNADFHIDVSVKHEACPLQLAPTSSTTATLVAGDALAMTIMKAREFKPSDFAVYHPGGSLGRKLLTTVGMAMSTKNLPYINMHKPLTEVISTMSAGRFGLAIVTNDNGELAGVITDGDLRRAMQEKQQEFFQLTASDMMTTHPKTVDAKTLLVDAEEIMAEKKINSLLVTDKNEIVGIVQIYDM